MTWILMILGLAILVGGGAATMRWLMGRALFAPGTVAARVVGRGEGLQPPPQGDPAATVWRVTKDMELRHVTVGSGRDLVVVHGGPAIPPAGPWRVALQTADVFRWRFYDQRGCGGSTRPFQRSPEGGLWTSMQEVEGRLGIAEQIADLERIRHLLGQERMVLVGHSFGALIAALYAAEWPERVAMLVLLAPAPLVKMPVEGADLFELVRARLPEPRRAQYDGYLRQFFDFPALLRRDEESLSAFFAEFGGYYGVQAAAPGRTGGFATLATYLSLGRRHDWSRWLRRVTAPVLVVHGADDLQPRAASERVARAFAAARLVEIPGAGHFLYDDQPEALARILREALARQPQ